jgi:Na+/phosphate symporter
MSQPKKFSPFYSNHKRYFCQIFFNIGGSALVLILFFCAGLFFGKFSEQHRIRSFVQTHMKHSVLNKAYVDALQKTPINIQEIALMKAHIDLMRSVQKIKSDLNQLYQSIDEESHRFNMLGESLPLKSNQR